MGVGSAVGSWITTVGISPGQMTKLARGYHGNSPISSKPMYLSTAKIVDCIVESFARGRPQKYLFAHDLDAGWW